MPSIPQPKNVSLLKILAYVFVFSGYVKYCSLHSAQDGFCALMHWAFQRPAGLYNHGWKCCECFLPPSDCLSTSDLQDCTNERWKTSNFFFSFFSHDGAPS